MTQPIINKSYDLRAISNYIGNLQNKGYVIANYGKYHGQFHYLGKLKKPIIVTGDGEVKQWLSQTPKAKIISVRNTLGKSQPKPEYFQKYRNKYLVIWDRSIVIKDPTIVRRN